MNQGERGEAVRVPLAETPPEELSDEAVTSPLKSQLFFFFGFEGGRFELSPFSLSSRSTVAPGPVLNPKRDRPREKNGVDLLILP